MATEKESYNGTAMEKLSDDSPMNGARRDSAQIVEEKGVEMGEAADIYGDLETAEDYGYVSRGSVYEAKWHIEDKDVD